MFALVVILVAIVFAVGLVEAALWIVAPIPYHEWMLWQPDGNIRAKPIPNQVIQTPHGEVRINKHGFRGPDYELAKKPGTLRVLVFGGSAGFCYNAATEEDTWPAVLQATLRDQLSVPVEVINLSLPGFDVFHSKMNYLAYGTDFNPDCIIVYHTWNDMKAFRRLGTGAYGHPTLVPGKVWWKRLARETQLGRRARNVLWNLRGRELEGVHQAEESMTDEADQPVSEAAFEWERRNFEHFASLARADGVLPVFVSQAGLISEESMEDPALREALIVACSMMQMTTPRLIESWQHVSEIIREVAQEQGALFVNGYDAVPHDLNHFEDHVHLLDEGARLLGEAIGLSLIQEPRFQELVQRVKQEDTGNSI